MMLISRGRRLLTGSLLTALLAGGLAVMVQMPATAAAADTSPALTVPATVSADALPTWQLNGVAWSQVVVGDTVYVTGSFTAARPPGSAAGQNEVAANNIFAYNITTGNPISGFSHSLNAQGLGITKSPDGTKIYVVGDFTAIDGAARNHVAAFNVSGGALTSFAPSVNNKVSAVTASNSTVWFGGTFGKVNNVTRTRLAAVKATDGSTLPFAPTADDGQVLAIVLTPDQSGVVAGGQFTTINGQSANGMGSVDATTGALRAWPINQVIRDGGTQCAINSLSADANNVYGSGYAFGCGNFEGSFAANGTNGAPVVINDCHGDTYGVFPIADVLYTVSHVHDCRAIGSIPQTDADWTVNQRKALAMTIAPHTTNTGPDVYGWNFDGQPASSVLQWFPELVSGSYTAAKQAAWSVTGNAKYVALAGEFPKVNNIAQQSLTRFAVSSVAPNKRGPAKVARAVAPNAPVMAPTAVSLNAGTARIAWQAAVDQDNSTLTYNVYRSGTTAPVYTTKQDSNFWTYPTMGYRDSGLTPGASYTYTIKATDPFNNVLTVGTAAVTVTSGAPSAYVNDVTGDGATALWRLGEGSGATVYDYAGFNDATAGSGVSRGAAGAIAGDNDTASTFDGTSDGLVVSPPMATTPSFTVEAWIKTASTQGGKIVGYGNANSGLSGGYDRHVFMDNAGHITFGVYPGGVRTVTGAKSYNDNTWHHIVATQGADGIALYVDGKKVGGDASATTAQDYAGYWRIGGDNLNGWVDSSTTSSFYVNGAIDDVAIYPSALSKAKIQKHYVDAGGTLSGPPAPTDTYAKAVLKDAPNLFWRLGEASGATTATDYSGNEFDGSYSGGYTLGVNGAVSGTTDTAASFNGTDGTIGSKGLVANPSVYSEELWFNTTTTHGGKLIGFGSRQSGNSDHYDRHVYMENDGRLEFGTYTGQINLATSTASYNDGTWHHMVATQGSDGMKLYVDGHLVGSNPQTQAEGYNGYWRVGGDSDWGGDSAFLAGRIDEVAVYGWVLDATAVLDHYKAGGGTVANQAPIAAFHSVATAKQFTFTSDSTDPDGSIVGYAWDFGDSTGGSTVANPNHTYAASGTYPVSLTVTDDRGATKTVTQNVTVANSKPTASFTDAEDVLKLTVNGSGSSDSDGTVTSYDWNWGDGSAHGSGADAAHTYASAGTNTVTLTVTDDEGATDTSSRSVTVAANQAPVARFTAATVDLGVSVDASSSSDPDGTVASYSWSWGDGTADGSGVSPNHTYATAGTKAITLTVTDNRGATTSATKDVTVTSAPANAAPTARFTSSSANLALSVDGSTSSDPDGTITSYAWSWGDNTPDGTGASPTHTYGAANTYAVKLTVTDNDGATNSITKSITVTAPATPAALVNDTFGRNLATGWGPADVGGSWAPKSGYTANFSVANGVGTAKMTKAGNSPQILLNSLSTTGTDSTATMSVRATTTGGGVYASLVGREVAAGGGYRATLNFRSTGQIALNVVRRDSAGAETSLVPVAVVPGVTYAAGDKINIRLVVSGTGPTTVRAKVWKVGTAQPAAWLVDKTDATTDLQAAGTVGFMAYLSGSSTDAPSYLDVDDLTVSSVN